MSMTWFISDKDHYEVVRELEQQTDRGAAIIGAAFLEERLSEAITSRLRDVPEVAEKLLNPSGPIGSLSVKIDLAYALGFFGPQCHRDLHLIRKIRNDFAHTLAPVTFQTKEIRHRCSELWLPKNVMPMGATGPPSSPRDQYLRAVNILNSMIWSEIHSSITKDKGKVPEPQFLRW